MIKTFVHLLRIQGGQRLCVCRAYASGDRKGKVGAADTIINEVDADSELESLEPETGLEMPEAESFSETVNVASRLSRPQRAVEEVERPVRQKVGWNIRCMNLYQTF